MKNLSIFVVVCLFTTLASAQRFSLLASSDEILTMEHVFQELTPKETKIDGITYWNFDKTYKVNFQKKGAPALPYFTESLIISDFGKTSLTIEHDGFEEFSNIYISPSKGNLKRNVNPAEIPYQFGEEYTTNSFFPAEIATLSKPYNLRNTRGITVQFSPYQYNPVTKKLRVYKNIRVKVHMDKNEKGINELATKSNRNDVFQHVYQNHYLNPDNVLERYTPQREVGNMLVICPEEFISEITPLIEWKNQSGVRTTLVPLSEVGSNDTEIKSYIKDFYNDNLDLVFVTLVGDHAQVPSHSYGYAGYEQLWSDSYYGQLVGDEDDFYPELFVGRISGTTPEHIKTQVDRILEYEKNPFDGDWMEKAIGIASNEGDGYGDDEEADWLHARNNREKLMNYGYTQVYEFYDGTQGGEDAPGNPNPQMIGEAVDAGVGLVNYTGHGAQNVCVTGNYSSAHINSAVNNGKYPFVISVACNNGTFTEGTCISEAWVQATNEDKPSGAIAACGSTILMAWAQPMQTQDEMADLISEAYPNNRKTTLGGLFYNSQMSMLETYNNGPTAIEVMQTWVMFGDPSTIFRNKKTMDLYVSHPEDISSDVTSITVDCEIDNALITIYQEEQIVSKNYTFDGTSTITFPMLSSDKPLTITATKQNHQPYQGVITVVEQSLDVKDEFWKDVAIYPNPATDVLQISWNQNVKIQKVTLLDVTGKTMFDSSLNNSASALTIKTNTIGSGIYILQITSDIGVKTEKIVVK
ncbi:C25 family cysteine peptidase [Aureivirga marina]|uniref:C25 family cysteine peptidase n=1 Tax=Aureivirga marina TaxID=1182451 RepID=UPI0018CBDB96|nr:C25 family cysteine peptidase [Aureivirga marina]